jgi:hypothetical protein
MSISSRCTSLLFALLVAFTAGCASTHVVHEWKDESLAHVRFTKVLAVFQTADPGLRRVLEDEMVRDLPNAVPSYKVFRDDEIRDIERVKSRVREQGFDAMVVMRVAGVDERETYVPPRPWVMPVRYLDPWGYWSFGWATVYDPGYLRRDRIVKVDTNIYSIPEDKLVFAAESESFDPSSLRNAIHEVVKIVARETGNALRARA